MKSQCSLQCLQLPVVVEAATTSVPTGQSGRVELPENVKKSIECLKVVISDKIVRKCLLFMININTEESQCTAHALPLNSQYSLMAHGPSYFLE